MKPTIFSILRLLFTLATATPLLQDPPDPIERPGVFYIGTGCPQGSVYSVYSDDRSTSTIYFDQYTAQYGPGIPSTENRKSCELQLAFAYPNDLQYSVSGVDYRGYAGLEEGGTGLALSNCYFGGLLNETILSTTFKGPLEGNYLRHVEAGSTVWSPCGGYRTLNVKSQVRISPMKAAKKVNLLTVGTADAKFEQKYFLQWRKCDETSGGMR